MATNCIRCGAVNPPAYQRERKYCSKKCSHAAWVEANPDRRAAHLRAYDRSEHGRSRRKRWESDNAETLSAKAQARYAVNRENRIAAATAWNKTHVEAHRVACRAYQKTEHGRKNVLENRWRRIARQKAVDDGFKIGEFVALCDRSGWRCFACLKADDNLQIDHVMPISKGGRHHISNMQPLCKTCNRAKGATHRDYRVEFALQPTDLIMEAA